MKISDKEGINCLNGAKVAIGWFISQLKMWLANLNYNFDVIGLLKCPITNLITSLSTRAVIGQFSGPYSPVRSAKI